MALGYRDSGSTFGRKGSEHQLNMVDGTGTSSWLYDNADNVTKLTTPQGVMDYVYDQWNRKTSLKEGTVETQYAYSQGRLSAVNKSNDGVSTGLFYDSYGRLNQKIDGMTKTTYGYDANDRLNSIVHSRTSDNYALHQETYNYDYANNLMSKVVNSVATSYTYDEIDQLKSEISSNQFGVHDLYTYDANGNRATKLSAIGGLTEYGYDDADKLMSVSKSTGTTTYQYDACGRPTNIGSRVLNWDYEDQLTNINSGGVPNTTYGYNGLGSRVSKANSNGSRSYKRDGVGVTEAVLSDGVSTMVPGISEKPTGGGTNTILTDRLGSMKGMANGANVTETAEFDAFGKVVAHGNPTSTQKGFASGFGYQEDGESGYKLLGHRYYDPETGRFLSRDPIGDGRNWYSYVNNNPLKSADPTGLRPLTSDEQSIIQAWIKIIFDEGDWVNAMILQQMLNNGRIVMDDDLPDGVLGRTDPRDHKIHLSPNLLELSGPISASVLIHELSHVIDFNPKGLFGGKAYTAEDLALSEIIACSDQLDFFIAYLLNHPGDTEDEYFIDKIREYQLANFVKLMKGWGFPMKDPASFAPGPHTVWAPNIRGVR